MSPNSCILKLQSKNFKKFAWKEEDGEFPD